MRQLADGEATLSFERPPHGAVAHVQGLCEGFYGDALDDQGLLYSLADLHVRAVGRGGWGVHMSTVSVRLDNCKYPFEHFQVVSKM